ncbi:hypothetical protein [Helicobacter sp. 23-1045]
MTLIIKNVKEEYLSAFKGLAEGTNATLTAEFCNESSECPICKSYNYEPSNELLEAIAEVERGEVTHCKDFEEYLVKINE